MLHLINISGAEFSALYVLAVAAAALFAGYAVRSGW